MKVKEVMMRTPYACRQESNLGTATELMWKGNCGFLPVLDSTGVIRGVLTDRDICIALGTRNVPAGSLTVREVLHDKLFTCTPDEDIHDALQTMREGRVHRLPGHKLRLQAGWRHLHARHSAPRRTHSFRQGARALLRRGRPHLSRDPPERSARSHQKSLRLSESHASEGCVVADL